MSRALAEGKWSSSNILLVCKATASSPWWRSLFGRLILKVRRCGLSLQHRHPAPHHPSDREMVLTSISSIPTKTSHYSSIKYMGQATIRTLPKSTPTPVIVHRIPHRRSHLFVHFVHYYSFMSSLSMHLSCILFILSASVLVPDIPAVSVLHSIGSPCTCNRSSTKSPAHHS